MILKDDLELGYGHGDGYDNSDNSRDDAAIIAHFLAIYLFEQEVMDEAKCIAERPEEYAQVLAIMWTETKLDLRRSCEKMAFETIMGMVRLQQLGFARVEEYGQMRKLDRRSLRQRHGLK